MSLVNHLTSLLTKPSIKPNVLQAAIRHKYTDDMWWLEQFAYQWLFIFDEMMSTHDFQNNEHFPCGRVEGVKFGTAYTKRDYVVYKHCLGEESYPVALRKQPVGETPAWADPRPGNPFKIKGELWLIRPQHFINLDNYKENGHSFLRKRITVVVPHHKLTFRDGQEYPFEPALKEIKVWTYVGNPEAWANYIDNGVLFKPVSVFRPNNQLLKPYYYFTPKELDDE